MLLNSTATIYLDADPITVIQKFKILNNYLIMRERSLPKLIYCTVRGVKDGESVELIAVLNSDLDLWEQAVQKFGSTILIQSVKPMLEDWPQKNCLGNFSQTVGNICPDQIGDQSKPSMQECPDLQQ
jgi:hypothetical protein